METKMVTAKRIPKTLSEMLQDLEVDKAIEIPIWRRQGAMSIINYWKKIQRFPERQFKSRKKDKKYVYIIRVS